MAAQNSLPVSERAASEVIIASAETQSYLRLCWQALQVWLLILVEIINPNDEPEFKIQVSFLNVKTPEKSAFIKAHDQAQNKYFTGNYCSNIFIWANNGKKDFKLSKLGLTIVWTLILKHLLFWMENKPVMSWCLISWIFGLLGNTRHCLSAKANKTN